MRRLSVPLLATMLTAAVAAGGETRVPVSFVADGVSTPVWQVEATATFSEPMNWDVSVEGNAFAESTALGVDIWLSADAPTNTQVLAYVQDWEYFWFQRLHPRMLIPGVTNRMIVDLSADALGWEPRGHRGVWNLRTLADPKHVGLRVFSDSESTGTVALANAWLERVSPTAPPAFRDVRLTTKDHAAYERVEVRFSLPDRYIDPFDAGVVHAMVTFTDADGGETTVDAYYAQDYYRHATPAEDRRMPQGTPYWAARFCPVKAGDYKFRLTARDALGETEWGPGTFTVQPARRPGFIRVSKRDPRFLEHETGEPFFVIGHNIRSPFDTRYDGAFPWQKRLPEKSSAYERFFRDMEAHGENVAEIWGAAWSLGLEWSEEWFGYHGIGQYNMVHAWEMDRVVQDAEKRGIYINHVIHNHGKYSDYSDKEWLSNPLNVANGGFLKAPDDYFTDPRAMRAFRKLMRYKIARWGYSPNILAWEFWSELDLTGTRREGYSNYRRPEIVDWHRLMGDTVKAMDPYDHLVSTHVCGDYSHQRPDIIGLPQMDLCPIDAYHGSSDPLQIVRLMESSAAFNNPYNKPVMITEFGGSSGGMGVQHMDQTLHAALWASTSVPIAGTPMLWWWLLIEEENFYPKYRAINRFMAGEDRRHPDMLNYEPVLAPAAHITEPRVLDAVCMKNARYGLGWIYESLTFARTDPEGEPTVEGTTLILTGMDDGAYAVEFWDTTRGEPVETVRASSTSGELRALIPAFARDIAFKVKHHTILRQQQRHARR